MITKPLLPKSRFSTRHEGLIREALGPSASPSRLTISSPALPRLQSLRGLESAVASLLAPPARTRR